MVLLILSMGGNGMCPQVVFLKVWRQWGQLQGCVLGSTLRGFLRGVSGCSTPSDDSIPCPMLLSAQDYFKTCPRNGFKYKLPAVGQHGLRAREREQTTRDDDLCHCGCWGIPADRPRRTCLSPPEVINVSL